MTRMPHNKAMNLTVPCGARVVGQFEIKPRMNANERESEQDEASKIVDSAGALWIHFYFLFQRLIYSRTSFSDARSFALIRG